MNAAPTLLTITDANAAAEAFGAALPVLLDFGTRWCPPCRAMDPHVAALAQAYAGRVRVGTCDIDDNQELAVRLGVRAAPTFVLLKGGVVVDRLVGAVPRPRLDAFVRQVLDAT